MLLDSLTERFAMRLDPGSWRIYIVEIGHVDHVDSGTIGDTFQLKQHVLSVL